MRRPSPLILRFFYRCNAKGCLLQASTQEPLLAHKYIVILVSDSERFQLICIWVCMSVCVKDYIKIFSQKRPQLHHRACKVFSERGPQGQCTPVRTLCVLVPSNVSSEYKNKQKPYTYHFHWGGNEPVGARDQASSTPCRTSRLGSRCCQSIAP